MTADMAGTIVPVTDDGFWVVPMFTVVARMADEGFGVVSHRVEHDLSVVFFRLIGWRLGNDGASEALVVAMTPPTMSAQIETLSGVLERHAPDRGASALDEQFRHVAKVGDLANRASRIAYRGEEAVWGELRRRAEMEISQDPITGQRGV